MHTCIHVYTPTAEKSDVPQGFYVRIIKSENKISKDAYIQYLRLVNAEDQLTEWYEFQTSADMLAMSQEKVTIGELSYDIFLKSEEVFENYMNYVKASLLENSSNKEEKKIVYPEWVYSRSVNTDCEILDMDKSLSDIVCNSHIPTCVLEHTLMDETLSSDPTIRFWKFITKEYKHKIAFYVHVIYEGSPQIKYRTPNDDFWKTLESTTVHVDEILSEYHYTLYELPSRKYVFDTNNMLKNVLSLSSVNKITFNKCLELIGYTLTLQMNDVRKTKVIRPAQYEILKMFLTNKDLQPFDLEHVYNIFNEVIIPQPPQNKIETKTHNVCPWEPIQSGNSIAQIGEDNGIKWESNDIYRCKWEEIKSNIEPSSPSMNNNIRGYIKHNLYEFQNIKESNEYTITRIPSPNKLIFQYGFYLYLVKKKHGIRHYKERELYTKIIDEYLKSNMDLMDCEFTDKHIHAIYPLLSENCLALTDDTIAPEKLFEIQILLSIYEHSVEIRDISQRNMMFEFIVKQFSKTLRKNENSRTTAKVVWDEFLEFLSMNKFNYVSSFGSQSDFNCVMQNLGWEQKRIATGKVWLNLEIPNR